MVLMVPEDAGKHPGVLIAHGFAGSKQLMLGYGYTLAHSGYAALLWDFQGHGANPLSLNYEDLKPDLAVAYATLIAQPEVDPDRVAILGHSMGAQAVLEASLEHPDRFAATVALSPGFAAVTPERPANLQLQAGQWESRAGQNVERLLQAAGGENGALREGQGAIACDCAPYRTHHDPV